MTLMESFGDLVEFLDPSPAQAGPHRWPRIRFGEREPIHPLIRRAVFERDGRRCVSCGEQLTLRTAQLDHIVPWSAEGSDYSDNLRILCQPCNSDRSNFRGALDWLAARRPPVTFECVNCAAYETCDEDEGTEGHAITPEMWRAFCFRCGIVAPAWVAY